MFSRKKKSMAKVRKVEFDKGKVDIAINLMWRWLADNKKFSGEFIQKVQEVLNVYLYHEHEIFDEHLFNTACQLQDMWLKYPDEFSNDFVGRFQEIIVGYFDNILASEVNFQAAQQAEWLLFDVKQKYPDKFSADFVAKLQAILEKYFNG